MTTVVHYEDWDMQGLNIGLMHGGGLQTHINQLTVGQKMASVAKILFDPSLIFPNCGSPLESLSLHRSPLTGTSAVGLGSSLGRHITGRLGEHASSESGGEAIPINNHKHHQ